LQVNLDKSDKINFISCQTLCIRLLINQCNYLNKIISRLIQSVKQHHANYNKGYINMQEKISKVANIFLKRGLPRD